MSDVRGGVDVAGYHQPLVDGGGELIDALAQAAGTTAVARLLETGLTDDVSIGSRYHVVALSKTLRVSGRARKAAPLFGAASSAGGEPLQACLSSA